MEKTLSAAQAAQILGVSPATLYAYVSRGLLRSISAAGVRSKRYAKDEVLRLAARNTDGRRAGKTVEAAIDWGVPVLESRITQIDQGTIRYRGQELLQLAQSASLEQAAQILWGHPQGDFFSSAPPAIAAPHWLALQRESASLAPLTRAMVLLPAFGSEQESSAAEPDLLHAGVTLMRVLAAALLGGPISKQPLHLQVVGAWGAGAELEPVLRVALVLCADHELNASTFTVRCVASTGANLYAAVTAGLAALSGARHGGESLRVRALLDATLHDPGLLQRVGQEPDSAHARAGFGSRLPGFGHPLYPDGDPRCRMLLDLMVRHGSQAFETERIMALAEEGQALAGQPPNVDFGLAALEYGFGWPTGAAQSLFALGRSAGWIAHAAEQLADGRLIRPRARYVGAFGTSGT